MNFDINFVKRLLVVVFVFNTLDYSFMKWWETPVLPRFVGEFVHIFDISSLA